jgi:hypothetical protein
MDIRCDNKSSSIVLTFYFIITCHLQPRRETGDWFFCHQKYYVADIIASQLDFID